MLNKLATLATLATIAQPRRAGLFLRRLFAQGWPRNTRRSRRRIAAPVQGEPFAGLRLVFGVVAIAVMAV